MIDKWLNKAGVAAGMLLALAGCAAQAAATDQAAAAPAPAMWLLSDEDTRIYMFGTIHLLPEGTNWKTAAVDRALASADEFVTEVEMEKDLASAAQAMMKLGVSPNLPPLVERVPEDRRADLTGVVEASGIPMAVLDRLETWAAGLTLTAVTLQQMGLDTELGVEKQIMKSAGGKTRGALETAEQQLGIFDAMSEETQRAFLLSVLEDPEEARREFAKMLAAWSRGDVDGVAQSFNADILTPELRDQLLTRRNANWAEWIEARLAKPGTVFMAVGAGHLAGEGSVQDMLKAKGLEAKRVQ